MSGYFEALLQPFRAALRGSATEQRPLYSVVADFVELVERSSATTEENERHLAVALDLLALAHRTAEPGSVTSELEAPRGKYTDVYDDMRTRACVRFPNYGFYRAGCLDPLGDHGVGDAIDDIVDIALDLRVVLWMWDHVGEADALWTFHFGYESHWGAHLCALQWYVHASLA